MVAAPITRLVGDSYWRLIDHFNVLVDGTVLDWGHYNPVCWLYYQ